MTGLSRIDLLKLKLSDLKEDGIHSQRQKTKESTGKRTIIEWADDLNDSPSPYVPSKPADTR